MKTQKENLEKFNHWFDSLPLDYQQRLIVTWVYMIIYDFLLCPNWVIKYKPNNNVYIHERQSYEVVGVSNIITQFGRIGWHYNDV